MRVVFKNKTIEIEIEDVTPLHDVLPEIEKQIESGCIIVDIKLNQQKLSQNWLDEADTIYLLNDDELEIECQNALQIAKHALANSKSSLAGIITSFNSACHDFRLDNPTQANHELISSIENLQLYLKVLEDALGMVGISLKDVAAEAYKIGNALEKLPECLNEFIEIQKQQDWLYLADMIEYELIPILQELDNIYEILPEEIR